MFLFRARVFSPAFFFVSCPDIVCRFSPSVIPESYSGMGSPEILIYGESVEQGVVLYKGCARSRTSLRLSSFHPFGWINKPILACDGDNLLSRHLREVTTGYAQRTLYSVKQPVFLAGQPDDVLHSIV